jgi:N-acyl-D-aspartate/D-glutamate deacylase
MDDGAFGIAPALIYPPNSYSSDHELTEMAKVVAKKGGLYIVHLRSEGDGFLEALEATANLSRTGKLPGGNLSFEGFRQAQSPQNGAGN